MNADFEALLQEVQRRAPENLPLLEPVSYTCETCEDLGVIRYNVPTDHPYFGKLIPCPDCEKGQIAQMGQWKRKLKQIGLPQSYADLTFDTFDRLPKALRAGKLQARAACELFATSPGCWIKRSETYTRAGRPYTEPEDFTRNWLVLQGPFGCGKTGLAAAAVTLLIAYGQPVLYMRVLDMIENVQATYAKGYDGLPSDEIIKEFRVAPVLVLDDLNVEIDSPNRKEILEKIIRHRHDNDLPTLITCNVTQKEMEAFWGKRIVSVLLGKAHWILVGGTPLRRELPPSSKEAF